MADMNGKGLRAAIDDPRRAVNVERLTERFLGRIEAWQERCNPFITVDGTVARIDAAASQELIEEAVRNYFAYRGKLNQLEFKHLLKQGRTSLVIGLLFLAICLLIRELVFHQQPGSLPSLMRESLTIAGWVAMWRPIQIFLYDWWPLRRVGHIYEKLSRVPVELRRPGAGIHGAA